MSDLFSLFTALDNQESGSREEIVRAPFGYPGGKSSSLDKILPHLPYRNLYAEPFGGSGSVMWARNPSPLEIFNDRYSGVTSFYRCIRDKDKMHALIERIETTIHSREEFLWCRDTWKNCQDEVERAARWYYMLQTSFGAQGRNFGRSVRGKAQMGPKIRNNLMLFHPLHQRIKHVQFENLDWRQCIKDFDQEDMVWYLDPPYYEYAKGMYEHEMQKEEHKELLERIFHLKGFVALSGYSNSLYDSYPWDNKYTWTINVNMLAIAFTENNHLIGKEDSIKRGRAQEVLWIKEAA